MNSQIVDIVLHHVQIPLSTHVILQYFGLYPGFADFVVRTILIKFHSYSCSWFSASFVSELQISL